MRQLKITSAITSRESISLEKYLSDIGKIDLLTPEEEITLAQRIKQGDKEALDHLVRANLRFVVSVAKQYQNQGLSLSDLINEGNVGLMKAAKRFDETKGFKFISYAVWWIRQAILQAIVEYSRMVRMPLNKMNIYTKANELYLKFIQDNEREPSDYELAELLDMDPKDIRNIIRGGHKHTSVDAPISDEEGSVSIIDLMSHGDEDSPDTDLMKDSIKKEIMEGLEILSPRESQILAAHFGLDGRKPMSFDEMSEYFDLSKERLRQIKDRAIRRMRRNVNRNSFNPFFS